MNFLWKTTDSTGHLWNYVQCSVCGLIRLDLGDSLEAWEKVAYPKDYYGIGFSKFTGAIQALREFSAWRRAREIHNFFPKPGRVLDIGCGEGLFLKYMKKLGWEVEGCEIGEQAAHRAEASLGQPIHRGELKTMPPPKSPYSVVMLWHVLEHVPNPMALLQQIADSVEKGGLLVVGVPNAASWQARIFGRHWFHLDPPRHLYSFGIRHLLALAGHTGWAVQDTRHFSLEYNPYGWAQSFLNSCGWRRDAMYETLKRHNRFVKMELLLRILAWALLGPSVLPAILESVVGKGGTIAVYSRRISGTTKN
jgi:2-polyprenyl-3-methyl-5-hydroxy-6-metoxy-1,4-benzoquinol methylase